MKLRDTQILDHIIEYCTDIEETLIKYGDSFESFSTDKGYQYILSFCIIQIGELVNTLSSDLRSETVQEINWREIKGMRNIVVHNYRSINRQILWDTVHEDIPLLKAFCEKHLYRPGD